MTLKEFIVIALAELEYDAAVLFLHQLILLSWQGSFFQDTVNLLVVDYNPSRIEDGTWALNIYQQMSIQSCLLEGVIELLPFHMLAHSVSILGEKGVVES